MKVFLGEAERGKGIAEEQKLKRNNTASPATGHPYLCVVDGNVDHSDGDGRLGRAPPPKLGVEPIRRPHLLAALLPLRVLLLEEVGDHECDVYKRGRYC